MRNDRYLNHIDFATGSQHNTKRDQVRIGFLLDESLFKELKALAISKRRSISGQIRHLLEWGCKLEDEA